LIILNLFKLYFELILKYLNFDNKWVFVTLNNNNGNCIINKFDKNESIEKKEKQHQLSSNKEQFIKIALHPKLTHHLEMIYMYL
jgi:hypothetical protein